MTVTDAHVHLWELSRGDYGWITPELEPLYRDFGPADLARAVSGHDVQSVVLVQCAPTEAETAYLLGLAARPPLPGAPAIAGVVGWTDLESDRAPERIAALAERPELVGLRPMIQDIPDPGWMLKPDLHAAFSALVECGLSLDLLILPQHMDATLKLLDRYPDLRAIVDHGAKPPIARGDMQTWRQKIRAIAATGNAFCKLSGLVTEARPDWTCSDLAPWVEVLVEAFGIDRLVWASDWPVVNLAGGYSPWMACARGLAAKLTGDEQERIFNCNARSFYRLH